MGLVSSPGGLYRSLFGGRRAELTDLARRTWEVGLLAAVVGVLTGGGVALLDTVIMGIEERVVELPLWLVAGAPAVGLALTAVILRWVGGGLSPSTADEYLKAFHDPGYPLPGRSLVARTMGAVATLGLGGPMGLEGSSIYLGTTIGSWIRRLTGRLPSARDRRVLLVAGAAAGVAAIFKAPATGAIFALEVPYQDDFARHMLLPSLVGAATGYLTFAAFHGTESLFRITESVPFDYRDLLAAIGLGIVAAIGARLFARGLRWSKARAVTTSTWVRVVVAGALLAAFVVISNWACGAPLSFGPGYSALTWALDPDRALWAVAVLLVVRCLATITVIGGGGVGGPLRAARRRWCAHRSAGRWSDPRPRRRAVHRDRGRRLPGRGLPGAPRRGDVRGRDHRPARVRGARPAGGGGGRAGDGAVVGDELPAGAGRTTRRRRRRRRRARPPDRARGRGTGGLIGARVG